jgi:hypothetical protein
MLNEILVRTKFYWSWTGGPVLIVRTAYKQLYVENSFLFQMLEANFDDEGDGYKISVVMAKPGVPSK